MVDATVVPTAPKCGPEPDEYTFEVVDVAPDDSDGGLVLHAGPGVETSVLGVLAWNAGNVRYVDCAFAPNGADWWQVSVGSETAWVNSDYLGDRRIAADSFAVTPCSREQSTVFPARTGAAVVGEVIVADIDVESSVDCDRIVVEMAEGFEAFDSVVTSLRSDFGADFIETVVRTDSEIQIKFAEVASFAISVDVEAWRDEATGEQNVAVLMEDYETGSTVYVGWGTGDAYLRFVQEPTPRIIIDIFQEPSAPNMLAGPIVGRAILFDPIQPDMVGPGVRVPITLRGWSRGFEATSVVKLSPWDQSNNSSPLDWGGELFGDDADKVLTSAVDLVGPLPNFGPPLWPFSTSGYFELTISSIDPGAYQLAIEPSSGCRPDGGTGQQFRVIDDAIIDAPSAGNPPALPFVVEHRWIGDGYEQSQTVTSVLGEEALGPVITDQC